MRLCNPFTPLFILTFLSLVTYYCSAHEHQNHVDPVTTKYSQSAVTVDPLSNNIESANVQKNNFQLHHDDDHLHDTIDARLQAKHNLRQSVHQHIHDDDNQEDEAEYINRLNSALGHNPENEIQFQYAVPPIADTVNDTLPQNETDDAVQLPSHVQNETTSPQRTSKPIPIESKKHAEDELPSTEIPPRADTLKQALNPNERSDLEDKANESIPPVQANVVRPEAVDHNQQSVVKEDILFIPKETLSSAQIEPQGETLDIVKSTKDHTEPFLNHQPPISNTIVNAKLQDNGSFDSHTSSQTTSQENQSASNSRQNISSPDPQLVQQNQTYENAQNNSSLDLKSEQPQTSDSIRHVDLSDSKSTHQDQLSETARNVRSVDSHSEQKQQSSKADTTRNDRSTDLHPEQEPLQKVVTPQNDRSTHSDSEHQQQPSRLDQIRNDHSTDLHLEQPRTVDTTPDDRSTDLRSEREPSQRVDTTHNHDSEDSRSKQEQPRNDRSTNHLSQQEQSRKVDITLNHDSQNSSPGQEQPQNDRSVDLHVDQQREPAKTDATQNDRSVDSRSEHQEQPRNDRSSDSRSEQEQRQPPKPDATQNDRSVDSRSEHPEQPRNDHSSDSRSEQEQLPKDHITHDHHSDDPHSDQEKSRKDLAADHHLEQQQQPSKVDSEQQVQNEHSTEHREEQEHPPKVDTLRNDSLLDESSPPPNSVKADQEQHRVDHPQSVNLSDQRVGIAESIQNRSSVDKNTSSGEVDQTPELISTVKPTEAVFIDRAANNRLRSQNEPPSQTPPPPTRILRSATSRMQQKAQEHQRQLRSNQELLKTQPEPENISSTENVTNQTTLDTSDVQSAEPPVEFSEMKPKEPRVVIAQGPTVNVTTDDDTQQDTDDVGIPTIDDTDLPRQVHVHDPSVLLNELKEESNRNENSPFDQEIENTATVASFLTNDHSPHLPRILENDETPSTIGPTSETMSTTAQSIEDFHQPTPNLTEANTKVEEVLTTFVPNTSDIISLSKYRQVCWRLPKPLESSVNLIENQTLRFLSFTPEFVQTILFGRSYDRETLMNTIWFSSICAMCFFVSLIFLSMGTKRLKQSKHDKEVRARCQQLQQYNNQLELERATFERQNQKLSDEIDELKNLPVRDSDDELFELRERCERFHADWKNARLEHEAMQKDIDYKQSLIQKHEFEMQKQVETVAYLNDETLRQKQELEKEREVIARLQSNDLSLQRFEKLQEIIHELKSETTQLKQDKHAQADQLQQLQDHTNQLDIDNNELTIKMKQLRDLLQQKDQTIASIRQKTRRSHSNDDDDEEEEDDEEHATADGTTAETDNNADAIDQEQQQLLSTIDHDVEKANQHMRDLHSDLDDKTRRIKEIDQLLNQEKERCRELETKLKVVLELRERDAHLHIRQLGQTDAELRKARTDTERVRILQQQLELKQQQLDDVQKVLASEQTKFSEDCSKLQHETHEKWMEVKRLTRELDGTRKECEGLRRQITKYANSERSSQEKTMLRPLPQHMNNTGRVSSEPETNGSSPPLNQYQQGENFRPIDHERNDSGAASPAEMFRIRPPMFGLTRPPFFPPPFMPPPNPFMMPPRFPMPMGGPHGLISPIPHLMTNGSGGGSDTNSFEIVDSANITPNSTSYDAQLNGSAASPTHDAEQQATSKPRKPKKSLKKRTKTSTTTVVPGAKEDV